ncbi:MAG: Gfo/Idh/MocA family oxidoreductase [Actinomycetota bacterium]|nr:Gfo/Idh/MocA family oxidoreductase [Actinomycetota bacterium]
MKPRLGFAGVGWIGRHRLERVAADGVAEVTAVYDPALPDADGLPLVDSYEQLLDQELDGVVIATPSALHAEQAIAALERGFAVFCQKPLGRTAPETARVVRAARDADRLLGVDLAHRWIAGARAIRELTQRGELGELFAAELVFHNAHGPINTWFYEPEVSGGGCLIDLGTNLVDLALWTLDWPQVDRVDANLFGEPVEHYAVAELQLAAGTVVRIACSWHLHAGRDAVIGSSFYGSEGGASLRNLNGSYHKFIAERYRGHDHQTIAEPPDDWAGRVAIEWAERLAGDGGFDPEVEHVVEIADVIDRIYEAAAAARAEVVR